MPGHFALTKKRTAAGGGFILVLRFGVCAVLNYGFGVALAWVLAPSQFGTVSVLQNVLLLCSVVLTASYPRVLARALARAEGNHSADATFRAAVAGNAALGALLVAMALGAQVVGSVVPHASILLVTAMAAMIALLSLNTTLAGALQGEQRFDALGVMQTFEISVKILVVLILVALFGGTADEVALGFVSGALVAVVIGLWAMRDCLPYSGPVEWRRTTAEALPMGIGVSALGVLRTIDVIALSLVGQGYGVSAGVVATYQVAAILARTPYFVADSLVNAVFPFIAKAATARAAHSWFVAAYRWVPLALVPLQLVLLVAPGAILQLFFPRQYAGAVGITRILTVGTLGLLTVDMLITALNARGLSALVARRAPVASAVEVIALVIAVPLWQTTGAAAAFAGASWLGALMLGQVYVRHHLTAWPSLRVIMRYLLALTPLVTLLAAADTAPTSHALVMIIVGLVFYAFAAVRLRLISEDDVARGRSLIQRLRPSRWVGQL